MSALVLLDVPVPNLQTGDQIFYNGCDWIVFDILPAEPGGWTVTASQVGDLTDPPRRRSLIFANGNAQAQLAHREVTVR